jgi:hypothetical protein
MNRNLINRISAYLSSNGEDYTQNTASDQEITDAEVALGLSFDKDYKEFIKTFGGCYVGESIYAFKNSSDLESTTMLELTEELRNNKIEKTEEFYVISFDGAGSPIVMNPIGNVLLVDYNTGNFDVLANNFDEFIGESLPD